jgi:hypothetical protein
VAPLDLVAAQSSELRCGRTDLAPPVNEVTTRAARRAMRMRGMIPAWRARYAGATAAARDSLATLVLTICLERVVRRLDL